MKTKTQLYTELNNIFSSGKTLITHINLESFYLAKELVDEINQDSALSEKLKSLLKFQLYLDQFNNRVVGHLNNIRSIIFDKIDNPFEVKKKCDFLYKENQSLYYLFKRLNSRFKKVNIEFNKETLDFLLLKNNAQKISLTRDNVKPIFKLITEYIDKQKIDESKIDDYVKELIQKFFLSIYCEIANINSEICLNNANDLGLHYTLEEVGDFLVLSPISIKPKTNIIIKPKPELLIDIWVLDKDGNKEYYYEVIESLQKNFLDIDSAFVSNINNSLHWNLISKKGSKSYLAGFIHTCIKRKWILDIYSALDLTKILKKTFNLETLDPKPFRNMSIFNKDEYINPFDFLKENK